MTLHWSDEASTTRDSFDIAQHVKLIKKNRLSGPVLRSIISTLPIETDVMIDPNIEKELTGMMDFTATMLKKIADLDKALKDKVIYSYWYLPARDRQIEDLKEKIEVARKTLDEHRKDYASILAEYKSSPAYVDDAVKYPYMVIPHIFSERNQAESFFNLMLSTENGKALFLEYAMWAYKKGKFKMHNKIINNLCKSTEQYDLMKILSCFPNTILDPGKAPFRRSEDERDSVPKTPDDSTMGTMGTPETPDDSTMGTLKF